MKKTKKFIVSFLAFLLSLCLGFSCVAVSGGAVEEITAVSPFTKTVYNLLDKAMCAVIKGIACATPTPVAWNSDEDIDGFMKGTQEFITKPADGASWSMGYDSRSIMLSEAETIGKLMVAGSISLESKAATEIVDDLKVRTIALNDGSGRGTAIIAVIDGYGLSLPDVREIRTRLSSYAKENDINSITVSVMHQHSAVDTFGMNGNIWKMLLFNMANGLFGKDMENGKDDAYMENLFTKCTESVKAATESLKEGKLYLGTADASKYTIDKRAPYVMDANFNRLRFVPADGSKETWLVSSPVHCVGNGAAGTALTGDYPYYAEKEIGEKANVLFYLGAELGTTQNRNEKTVYGYNEDMTRLEEMAGFGKSIGIDLKKIENEQEISPLLNVRYKEISFDIDNPILLFAGKLGMFENLIKKVDGEYKVISEIGYIELGDTLAFSVVPGELAAEIAYGGYLPADYAWSGKDCSHKTMTEILKENGIDRDVHVLGLANDQIGYIVAENDYMPMIHENSQSIEFVSLGKNTASTLLTSFEELIKE